MVLLLVLVVGACNGPPSRVFVDVSDVVTHRSGDRLRAKIFDAGEGATIFREWWDSELLHDCRFALADDGKTRCLPGVNTEQHVPGAPTGLVYTDPECDEPIRVGLQEAIMGVAAVQDRGCEDPKYTIHMLGDVVPDVERHYTKSSTTGECEVRESNSDHVYQEIGQAVPSSRFVAATLQHTERTTKLDVQFWAGVDGSVELVGPFDRERKQKCTPSPYGHRPSPCVPEPAYATWYHTDASCENLVAYAPGGALEYGECHQPEVILSTASHFGGQDELSLFALGPRIEDSPIYWGSGCWLVDAEERGSTYYEIGEPLGHDQFPELTEVTIGEGTVRALYYGDITGAPSSRSFATFVDAETGRGCLRKSSCDQTERCLTRAPVSPSHYTDASCSEPLVRAPCDIEMSDYLYEAPVDPLCPEGTTLGLVYELAGKQEGDAFHRSGNDCVMAEDENRCNYFPGDLVDPGQFSIIVDRVE